MPLILVVDDEELVRRLLARILDAHGHECVTAAGAAEARDWIGQHEFALVLCDLRMPGESGLELAEEIIAGRPRTAVVMVSGEDDPRVADMALELGAYGYITKPFTESQVAIGVSNALRRRELEIENRNYREGLEIVIAQRTEALREALERVERTAAELRHSREETIRRLSLAVEFRNPETGGHIDRMSSYCRLLAGRLGLDDDRKELLRIASPMHDVGKIGITDAVLLKPGPLTDEEWTEMRRHTEIGHSMLAEAGSGLLDMAAIIALTHHERWDGLGYPAGLSGRDIPLEGRITAIADVFDALTSDRVYRPAFPTGRALDMLTEGRGTQFDPTILDAFLGDLDDVQAIAASRGASRSSAP